MGPAAAGAAVDAVLNARALRPLNVDRPIAVEPLAESDLNLRLADAIVRELAARGHRVAPDAERRLVFDTQIERVTAPGKRLGGEANIGGSGARLQLDWTVPLQPPADVRPGASYYSLNLSLLGQDGLPIWQAHAAVTAAYCDRYSVCLAAVTALLDRFGRTVTNERMTFR